MKKDAWALPKGIALGPTPEASAALLGAMLHAVWLVDPRSLTIVAANAAAGTLLQLSEADFVGRPVSDFAATPEDEAFWLSAATARDASIESETLLRRGDGQLLTVMRRVSPMCSSTGAVFYLVSLVDLSAQLSRQRELEETVAGLQATLESLLEGILVTDLRGNIRNFNRRFADLWELPAEILLRRDDEAVLQWMEAKVTDPARYRRRLEAIDDAAMTRSSDLVALRGGRMIERWSLPQCSHGRPIGRVFAFREIRRTDPEASHAAG